MAKQFREDELADLATIDLTDAFLEDNIDRPFNATYARQTLNATTEQFVKSFLVEQGDSIARLHHSLTECSSVLGDMEEVLQQFISQLDSIQQDIGHVREVLAETAVQLTNTKAAEKVLWTAVSCLVVPPEVVQVVTQSNEEQLGPQFMLCVKELLKYLNYRKGTWRQTLKATQAERAGAPSRDTVAARVEDMGSSKSLVTQPNASSQRIDTTLATETETLREVRFSLAECRVYYDLMSILDALTLYACIKIKTFLSKKLLILTNKNTNVCIQQDHVLKQYAFYVHFLRTAVPLLRHVYSAPPPAPGVSQGVIGSSPRAAPPLSEATAALGASGAAPSQAGQPSREGNDTTSSNSNTTLIPYRIVRALYEEFKQEYCTIVANIYLQKIQDYAFFCNSMEFSTEATAATNGAGAGTGGLGGGFWGFGASAASSPYTAGSAGMSSGGGGIGSGSSSAPNYAYTIPLITDTKGGGAFVSMRLEERAAILNRVFSPPLIPTMERVAKRKHTYEETFRSILSLTCDIVTHEYLFTFDFFSGDMSVYVDVFKPTVQFIVDYVSEVVLVNSSGDTRRMLNERPRTSVNVRAKQDTYGLLILIRLCQEYRSMMKHARKLSCLDGFFDSLLMLLWPPFNICYERQLNALMTAKNGAAMYECMNHLRRIEDRLSFVHPVVKAFAEFSCALMSVSYGAVVSDEIRTATSAEQMERRQHRNRHRNRPQSENVRSCNDGGHAERVNTCRTVTSSVSSSDTDDSSLAPLSLAESGTAVTLHGPAAVGGPPLPPPLVGSKPWEVALRQQALARIDQEHESDAADSKSHFLTLMGDVGFMRLELAHLVVHMGEEMVEAEANVTQRDFLRALSKAFALNNMFYLLQVSARYPVLVVTDDSSAQAQRTSVGGNMATDLSELTLDQRDDLNGLKDLFSRFRGEFVEHIIRNFLGGFLHVVQNDDECTPDQVLQVADRFLLNWKDALDGARQTVGSLISDPANARETTAQVCMDILLYNTRFHGVVAKCVEACTKRAAAGESNPFQGRTLRSLIVTNQLLLQHMRTFSIPLAV